jgi:uncharacterized paraquat-inducible protein A
VFPPLFSLPLCARTYANMFLLSQQHMWEAEVYALALVILCFSGIWTYVKLSMLIVAFFMPGRILSPPRRERMLIILDSLGKWSLVDAYVLVMMMVGFLFTLGAEDNVARIVVVPGW